MMELSGYKSILGRSFRPSFLRLSCHSSRFLDLQYIVAAGITFTSVMAAPAAPVFAQAESSIAASPGSASTGTTLPVAAQPSLSGESEKPGITSKVQEAASKNGKPSVYGTATKPGFFAVVEQGTAWAFPRTGTAWGTGAAVGTTFVGFGVSGNIKGSKDNLLTWSAQLGPAFQHAYYVPGNDRTPLRIDLFASLSPLRGDDLNIYSSWRGLYGNDVIGQLRFQNTVRTGIIYSFAGSRIIPDAIEEINLPERGFYARVEPSWIFGLDGQLNAVQTQAYLGWSETFYPFTFAVEAGPQFIQAATRELQTTLGSFFDLGYVLNRKTRAYLRYRPALSFGGNQYPAATQVLQAGLNYRF